MYMRDGFEKILEYEGKIYRLVQTLSEQEGVDLVLMDQFIEAVNSLSDTVETELVDFENVSPLGRLVCGSVNDKEGAINGFMQRMSQEWPHLISGRLAMPGSDKEPSLSVSNQEDAENMEPLYAERCKQKARRSRRVETNLWMKELDELC